MDKWKRKGSNDIVSDISTVVVTPPPTSKGEEATIPPLVSTDKWSRKSGSTSRESTFSTSSSSSVDNGTSSSNTVKMDNPSNELLTKYGILFGLGGFSILFGSVTLRSGIEKWIANDEDTKNSKNKSKTRTFLSHGVSKPSIPSATPKLNFSPIKLAVKAILYGGIIASTVVGSVAFFTYKVIIPPALERDRKRYQDEYNDNQINELVSKITSVFSDDNKLR